MLNDIKPIVIIGAPRSGTNILRDTLTKIPSIKSWDCDEIPYIWLYGNKNSLTDVLKPDMLNSKIKNFIRYKISDLAKKKKVNYIVEKTCANSLRVDYIDQIIPESKYIFIQRDPLDAISSTMLRWNSKFDLKYTIKKFKYVPRLDIPFYSYKFLINRFYRKKNKNRLKFWGPRFMNEEKLLGLSVEEIAAMQWAYCIKLAKKSLYKMKKNKVFYLTYEKFVNEPESTINEIMKFIGIDVESEFLIPEIRKDSIGKGNRILSQSQKILINKTIKKHLN